MASWLDYLENTTGTVIDRLELVGRGQLLTQKVK